MKTRSWQFKAICEKEQDQRQGLLYLKQKRNPSRAVEGNYFMKEN